MKNRRTISKSDAKQSHSHLFAAFYMYIPFQQEPLSHQCDSTSPKKTDLKGSLTHRTSSSRPPIADRIMKPLLTILFIFIASSGNVIMEQTCPTQDISPCTCTKFSNGDVRVDCSRASSAAEISSALTKASWNSIQLWWANIPASLIFPLPLHHTLFIDESEHCGRYATTHQKLSRGHQWLIVNSNIHHL